MMQLEGNQWNYSRSTVSWGGGGGGVERVAYPFI